MNNMKQRQFCVVVAVIQNEKGEILLARRNEPKLKHAHNKWEFVGGGIEFGENPEEALKREVKEEAGVEIKIIRLLPKVISHVWNLEQEQEHVLLLHYECKIIGGELKAGQSEEVSELKFFPLEEIKKLDTLPQIYEGCLLIQS